MRVSSEMGGMLTGAAPGRIQACTRRLPEVALPLIVAILLGVFWLGVLVTVAFTAWRLLANLKTLMRSLGELNERLAPTLRDLEARSQETAELSERLQRRQVLRQAAGRRRTSR